MDEILRNSTYVIDGHGTITIDIANTKRNFYPSQVNGSENFSVEILQKKQEPIDSDKFHIFEWQPITIIGLFSTNQSEKSYKLFVNNKETASSKNVNSMQLLNTGFTFKDQVGITEFKITCPLGNEIFRLKTEVFPQKMDYKSDYRAIMEDISKIIHNLTYSILRDTYQKAKPKVVGQTTEIEWWNIFDTLYEALIKSIEIIRRNPKHDIVTEQRVESVDRIKKHSPKNRVWLQQNTKFCSFNPNNGIELITDNFFSHALSVKKKITYDNYENRFVKYAAKQTIYKLMTFKRDLEKYQISNRDNLNSKTDNYISRLSGFLMQSPFHEVGNFEKQNHFSTTLTKASGYKDFLQIHQLLQKGLDISNDDIFKIESKNISQLYEYWCFLKLTDIVMRLSSFRINYQDLINIQAGKFKVDLREGEQSKIKFKNSVQEEINIYFNREFTTDGKKTFTFKQKPDHTLKFTKKGYDKPFWFIFDAKYRFNEALYTNNDSKDSETLEAKFDAPDDAIGQLHRYRDAILHSELDSDDTSYKTTIKNLGGIILYPYPKSEKEYTYSKYFKSIDYVNIGALPMLPSKTTLVENYLNKLFIEKTPEDHYREFVGMDYSEYVSKREEFDKTVTIGLIKSNNQDARLDYLKTKNIHYVPHVENDKSRIYRTEYVLLTRSGKKMAELRKVIRWEIMTKEELRKTGTTWALTHVKYIVFHLDSNIETIEISKDIIPINFRYTTLRGLNLYKTEMNSRALYITNESAYKLYSTLQRTGEEFKMEWSNIKDDKTGVIFKLSIGLDIESSGNFPYLQYLENGLIITFDDVLTKIKEKNNEKSTFAI
ncbi:MAG: DUF2357 domain-containing protein [Flavobacteriales bacterium]|nr:DUF2357 domain-containing protein [Flavobacteriales bacterium]